MREEERVRYDYDPDTNTKIKVTERVLVDENDDVDKVLEVVDIEPA